MSLIVGSLIFAFLVLMIMAAISDMLTMTIPNWISLALSGAFLVAAPLSGLPWMDLLSHFGAGAIVLLAGFVLFAFGAFGGGDAKLLAAAALWVGFDHLLPFLFLVGLFGGVLALAILAFRQFPLFAAYAPIWAMRLHSKDSGIPFGIAIAGAAILAFPQTSMFGFVMG